MRYRLITILSGLLISASLFCQVDKKEVRGGNKFFKKGEIKEAEVEYKKALLKDSTSMVANYNLGNTLYRLESADEALKYYKLAEDSVRLHSKAATADLFHNTGNTYLTQKKYKEAIEAFKESLRKNPTDMETKSNLAYAQKMLKEEENQDQQDQDQDQNQDEQDQNQDQQDQNKDQDQQDQNKDQNQQDQNQDQQDQNKDEQKQNTPPPKIDPKAAQQMLQAIEDKEKETQDKVNKEKAKLLQSRQKEKNW